MRFDRAREAVLVSPAFLDVTDQARQHQVSVMVRDQLPECSELVVGDDRLRAEGRGDSRRTDEPSISPSSASRASGRLSSNCCPALRCAISM